MAVGARGRDILLQFLVEAVTLSSTGGIIGILFGVSVHSILKLITDICVAMGIQNATLAAVANGPTLVSATIICTAFFFSGLIGVVSGFYPAWKASKLDPIDALRYE
jgi:putative ABC transport system permease protein